MPLLELQDVSVEYGSGDGPGVRVVSGVSFAVGERESVGLVGESGCGKTSLANAIMGVVPLAGGRITFGGRDAGRLAPGERRRLQMMFQDPFDSLNPRLTVGDAVGEVLSVHGLCTNRASRLRRVEELLGKVGLPADSAGRFPHEFSGGQRQRVGLARALAAEPSLVIADEPVSALDVSVQARIMDLMVNLQAATGLAYLFIAHDLAVVRRMCARVLVMYLGRIMEAGPSEQVFRRPAHPYTEALVSAVPDVAKGLRARTEGSRRIVLRGDVPSPADPIGGCPFHTRCHKAMDVCRHTPPTAARVADGRVSTCHLAAPFD
jgi:oligopeptide/dipeptide ABC transporter ATP-binding protein